MLLDVYSGHSLKVSGIAFVLYKYGDSFYQAIDFGAGVRWKLSHNPVTHTSVSKTFCFTFCQLRTQ